MNICPKRIAAQRLKSENWNQDAACDHLIDAILQNGAELCDGFIISALPYKLVLCEEGGGFFLPYHDTEKVPGMFACPPNVCLPPPTKKALSWREVGGCEQLFLCHMFPFVASSLTRATLVIQLPARGAGCAAQE